MADVIFERREGGIAWITLNRPESLNAMGGDLMPLLAQHLDGLRARSLCPLRRPHGRRARLLRRRRREGDGIGRSGHRVRRQ